MAHTAAAGCLAALANLCRGDGVLLLPFCLGLIAVRSGTGVRVWKPCGVLVVAYLMTMTPWYVRNLRCFGVPMPSSSAKTMLFREYEDLYRYRPRQTREFLEQSPVKMARERVDQLSSIAGSVRTSSSLVVLLTALCGLAVARRVWLWAGVGWGLVLTVFYAFVAPYPSSAGGFAQSWLSVYFFACVAASSGLIWFAEHVSPRAWSVPQTRARRVLLVGGVAVYALIVGEKPFLRAKPQQTDSKLTEFRALGAAAVASSSPGRETVIMTRDPWEVHYATGLRSVQMPSDGWQAVHEVCSKYAVTHIRVSDSERNSRRFLREVSRGRNTPPWLHLAWRHGGAELYRLQ